MEAINDFLFTVQGPGMNFHPQYNWLVTPFFILVVPFIYLVSTISLFFFVELNDIKIPKTTLKPFMFIYNLSQIILCSYMTWGLSEYFTWDNPFAIHKPEKASIEWFILVHALSKYLDWCDTLFIILNRNSHKQLSVLHIYHHMTIGSVAWNFALSQGVGGGVVAFPSNINNVTHVLLYSHYMMTSFGFRNPLKKWLTRWQITQFYLCILHPITGVLLNDYRKNFAMYQIAYHCTMIYLFGWHMDWRPGFVNKYSTANKKKLS